MTQVAVVGAGLIGRAWSIVFARAGFDVLLWDPVAQQVEAALAFIDERLPELEQAGLLKVPPQLVLRRVPPAGTLAGAADPPAPLAAKGPEPVRAQRSHVAELHRP